MIEYMRKKVNLSIYGAIEIIMGSHSSLEDKISAIRQVSVKLKESESTSENWTQESVQIRINDCDTIIKVGEFSLNEMTNNNPAGTVFILTEHSVVNSINVNPTVFPFTTTFEAAKCGLIEEADAWWGKESDEKQYNWYHINKWIPASDGGMQHIAEWKLSHEGVVWEVHVYCELNDIDTGLYMAYCDYLEGYTSSCTPYQTGDIVTVDCRPARKVSHGVIVKNYNIHGKSDREGVIYFTENGELKSSDLKSHLEEYNRFSGSYRLAKFTGELPDCEAALKKISDEIKRNPALSEHDDINKYLAEFSGNIRNFLSDGTIAGDIIKISSSSYNYSGYDKDFDAVITDMNSNADDVEVIQLYRRSKEIKWRRISLKSKLENRRGFVFERYTEDIMKDILGEFSDNVFELLIKISEEIKGNPALANDDKFIETLVDKK